MARIGVVLSGCGVFDGAEIHESVLTLLALDQAGVEVACFAPDRDLEEIDHLTQKPTGARRNALTESARIARGAITPLSEADPATLDAVIFPGGFGAAKNLSDFASKGADAEVLPEVVSLISSMHDARKPIGAICIAPATVAAAFKGSGTRVQVTIGNDRGTAEAIRACGAEHRDCPVDQIVVDEQNRLVTTPAYMLGPSIKHVAIGIGKLVKKVIAMAG